MNTENNTIQSENQVRPVLISRLTGGFISVIFHPVFLPVYVTAFCLYLHPTLFIGFSEKNKMNTLFIIILNMTLFPVVSVLLLKGLGFIESFFLKTQKDRIIPYIGTGIFFFWTYTVFKQQTAYPLLFTSYLLGVFFASSAALIANIYFKISMHAIGMGTWLGFFLMIMHSDSMLMTWPLFFLIILCGLVCSARLLLKSHQPLDMYAGLLLGVLAEAVAYLIIC